MNRGSLLAAPLHPVLDLQASMRPRFMNRGSAGVLRIVQRGFIGFNEAPIHESGKSCKMPSRRFTMQLLQ